MNQRTKPKSEFRCNSCNNKTNTLYIVARGELCINCLTAEDVAIYPDFAEQLDQIREEKAA